jgi:hypothetical protein
MTIPFRPFGVLASMILQFIWHTDLLTMSVLLDGYSETCAHNKPDIYVFNKGEMIFFFVSQPI